MQNVWKSVGKLLKNASALTYAIFRVQISLEKRPAMQGLAPAPFQHYYVLQSTHLLAFVCSETPAHPTTTTFHSQHL